MNIPDWYQDAKLGIMVHWGLPSVPAYAPTGNGSLVSMLRENTWPFYFANNPYSEWYENSLRIQGSATREHHRTTFHAKVPYHRFAQRFNASLSEWDPDTWVDLFQETGARYLVMVAKHHDGFLMWPSEAEPKTPGYVASRDVIGELAAATRNRGLRYGIYYSGLLDWTEQTEPITDLVDMITTQTTPDYADYVFRHFTELIDRYTPDMLWNDIGLPHQVSRSRLLAYYREKVPTGVVNDRWRQIGPGARALLSRRRMASLVGSLARKAIVAGKPFGGRTGVATREYADQITLQKKPWELVRSLGHSFAYNAQEVGEDHLTGVDLVHLLADVVSKNGNLLLNVGPRANGSIPEEQLRPLAHLSRWIKTNGDAIYGTRPWYVAEGVTDEGVPVRYTTGKDALYCILLGRPRGLTITLSGIDLNRLPESDASKRNQNELDLSLLGFGYTLDWNLVRNVFHVRLPGSFVPDEAMVIKIGWEVPVEQTRGNRFYTDVI